MVCATKPSWRRAVEDAKSWRHGLRSRDWRRNGRRRRLGPRYGRGGDGRRAASRAVRRPSQEWRLGPRHGGGNLPARGVLVVFSKPDTYPGFADPPKPRIGSSSTWRHRGEDFVSKKEPQPLDEIMYRVLQLRPIRPVPRTGLTGLGAAGVFKSPLTCPWESSLLSPFLFSPSPSSCSRLGPRSPTQRRIRL